MTPDLPDDDARADALADEAVDFACKHHPSESPRFRRYIARLYIRTRLNPEARTAANLATLLGTERRRVPEIEASALAKLRRHLREKHPELFT